MSTPYTPFKGQIYTYINTCRLKYVQLNSIGFLLPVLESHPDVIELAHGDQSLHAAAHGRALEEDQVARVDRRLEVLQREAPGGSNGRCDEGRAEGGSQVPPSEREQRVVKGAEARGQG